MSFPDFNINYDAEYYDLVCQYVGPAEQDVLFIRGLCAEYGGPVLEVCVGTGRVAIPLASDGFKVTGVDRDENMLARCREKLALQPSAVQKRLQLVKADMRDFKLKDKFRTAFIAFNSLLALTTREDQIACLSRIREHLEKGQGRFILDIFNPNLEYLTRGPGYKHQEYIFTDEATGIIHDLEALIRYDEAAQVSTILYEITHTKPDGSSTREIKELKMKMLFPDELMLLLDHCGFKVLHRWGNYERDEFKSGMGKQLVVAKVE